MAYPTITPADFVVGNVLCRRRDTRIMENLDDRFLFYQNKFDNSNNPFDMTVATSNGTATQGQGKFRWLGNAGVNICKLSAPIRLPCAQITAAITIESLNTASGTYSDASVGFAITPNATSTTIQDWTLGRYRRLATNTFGYIETCYTYNSGANNVFNGENVSVHQSAAYNFPLKLQYTLNHNSALLSIVEPTGLERILMNLPGVSGNIANGWDFETTAHLQRLMPIVELRGDAAIDVTISNWEVRANGMLGAREHYVATYENGEPIRDPQTGYMFITADATHGNALNIGAGPVANGAYMRNQSTTMYYNPDTGRMGAATGKYAIVSGSRTFGSQQGKVMFDRNTMKWHYYFSKWNDVDVEGRVKICHYETYENLLFGYHVISDWEIINLDFAGNPLNTYNYYDSDVVYYAGRWYLCGTVNTIGSAGRVAFLVSGTAPNSFDRLEYMTNINGGVAQEGTRIWMVGGKLWVATGEGTSNVRVYNPFTATSVANLTINGGGRYSHQCSLIPYVKNGKTSYQVITFSDYNTGEDLIADYNGTSQSLTFGPTVVTLLNQRVTGEEFPLRTSGQNYFNRFSNKAPISLPAAYSLNAARR